MQPITIVVVTALALMVVAAGLLAASAALDAPQLRPWGFGAIVVGLAISLLPLVLGNAVKLWARFRKPLK